MHLGLFDAEKNETRHEIRDVGDIYRFADELRETVKRYDEGDPSATSGPAAADA